MRNRIPIQIDDNPDLGYEKNSWLDICKWPLMWTLAFWVALKKKILGPRLKINTFWFDGLSPICREVKENSTSWKALDIIYNYRPREDKSLAGQVTDFWNRIRNIKAVRNRLRLIKQQLKENIQRFSNNEREIRLISIASGSAQGVIEVMKEFKQKGIFVNALFLDLDSTAIEYSKNLAQEAGVVEQITFVNKSTRELENVMKEFKPHIVEMTGFLEYRPKEKAINLLKKISNFLSPEGLLLTGNVSPNPEKIFSYWVGNWPMIYRTPKQLSEVIIKAGFNPQDCKIIREPLRIHNIAICRKSPG